MKSTFLYQLTTLETPKLIKHNRRIVGISIYFHSMETHVVPDNDGKEFPIVIQDIDLMVLPSISKLNLS